ncbi:hypothetical protein N9H39_07740 [Gammaproteobacteria bacterium]|nr:hypothetical protein [Gammaproteobacteria bacterium]
MIYHSIGKAEIALGWSRNSQQYDQFKAHRSFVLAAIIVYTVFYWEQSIIQF